MSFPAERPRRLRSSPWVRRLVAEGIVAGGMIPKVECCVRALAQGVRATHIVDGRTPHSLLLEVLTDVGGGTMITG